MRLATANTTHPVSGSPLIVRTLLNRCPHDGVHAHRAARSSYREVRLRRPCFPPHRKKIRSGLRFRYVYRGFYRRGRRCYSFPFALISWSEPISVWSPGLAKFPLDQSCTPSPGSDNGLAGTPATRVPGATSRVTTEPAPVLAPRPIETGATSMEPDPMNAFSPI